MVTAFIIGCIILFSLSMLFDVLVIGYKLAKDDPGTGALVFGLFVNMAFLTWAILALVAL